MDEQTVRIVDNTGEVLGVAFAVPILDSARAGTFFLSAGHTVWNHYQRRRPVRLATHAGTAVDGVVVLACTTPDDLVDVALLYADEPDLPTVTCLLDVPARGTPVVVRGSPSGVGTLFANFRGVVHGRERLGAMAVLDIALDDLTVLDRPPGQRSARGGPHDGLPFRALRGLSGAPVMVAPTDASGPAPAVCGLVSRRNTQGIANRVLAVPVADVRRALAPAGHVLLGERSSALPRADVIHDWLGASFLEAAASPEREHALWERLSAGFYAGQPVDDVLLEMATAPARFGLTDELSRCFLDYFCSRLLAKAGRSAEAAHFRGQVLARATLAGNEAFARIAALTRLRHAVEQAEGNEADVGSVLDRFERAAGRFAELDTLADPYKAYELASATGRLAMELCRSGDMSSDLRRHVDELAGRHAALVRSYADVLVEKQEIVQLGLDGLRVASEVVDGTAGIDRLDAVRRRGSQAARQRRNAIFQAQMLLLDALALWRRDHREASLALTIVVVATLRSASLSVRHEGVAQIHALLGRAAPPLAEVMTLVSLYGPGAGIARATHPTDPRAGGDQTLRRAARRAADRLAELDGMTGLLGLDGGHLL